MPELPADAWLHVGSYAEAGGRGLYPVTLSADGALACGEPFAAAANASFAACAAGRWYIVDETAGSIGLFSRAEDRWQLEGRFASEGEQPCYLALDSAGRLLAAANYGSGNVAVWHLGPRGLPARPPTVRHSGGSGPVAERQKGPHCHCAVFDPDGGTLYIADLGADAIRALPLHGEHAAGLRTAHRTPAGSGPRHLLFATSRLAVLLSELGSTLTTLEPGEDQWRPVATRSTLPDGFAGESLGGHLALGSGARRVYASNRGHDSLAVFGLDETGRIELLQHVASGGSSPRHFLVLEDLALLVVAHEKDGALTSFRIGDDGCLTPTGHRATVPGSCFVLRTGA